MIHVCNFCGEEIKDKDEVTFVGITLYKQIPSKIAFALNTEKLTVLPDTLCHYECRQPYYET